MTARAAALAGLVLAVLAAAGRQPAWLSFSNLAKYMP